MARSLSDEPPTLMGLMMSTTDLPSTSPNPGTGTRPASTWHSEADTASTAVDSHPAVVVTTTIDADTPTPTTPSTPKPSKTTQSKMKENFIQVSSSPAVSTSEDEAESPPQQRGRLMGHIVSIEGIKRSLSQTDLRVRKGSRIRSAMSKLSGRWKREGERVVSVGVVGGEKK